MRKLIFSVLALAVVATASLAPARVEAQALPVAHIAVVDIRLLESKAKAMLALRPQIEQIRARFQQELGAQDQALKAERQQLDNDRALLSPDLFRERRQQLQEKIAAFQRTMQIRTRQLDQGVAQARGQFHQAVGRVIKEVMGRRGANVVVQKQSIVSSDINLDITAEVLQQVDQAFPTVQLVLPQN